MLEPARRKITGEDNLETVRLIWACYESAETGRKIVIKEFILIILKVC